MIDMDVTFNGRTPLVLHNIRLANPLDPHTKALKALTGKRKKTDKDHEDIAQTEWEGGLYIDAEHGPYLPVSYPLACLRAAGVITKEKTAVSRAVTVSALDGGVRIPIEYDGPRTIEELWANPEHQDMRGVRVQSARTMRCRPRFPEWAITFRVNLDETIINPEGFEAIAERAGRNIGLGEAAEGFRARFDSEVKIAVAA